MAWFEYGKSHLNPLPRFELKDEIARCCRCRCSCNELESFANSRTYNLLDVILKDDKVWLASRLAVQSDVSRLLYLFQEGQDSCLKPVLF